MVTTLSRIRDIDSDIDLESLDKQTAYYKELKNMTPSKLKLLHKKTFHKSKWWVDPPVGIDRMILKEWLIRRLWIYYAVKNYHFPDGSQFKRMFVRRAKKVLTNKLDLSDASSDNILHKKVQDSGCSWITKEGIDELTDIEVDQALAQYGVRFEDDIPMDQRRYCLWEMYTKPGSKTLKQKPKTTDEKGRDMTPAKRGTTSRSARGTLRSAVIESPHLCYNDFIKKYRKNTTVTRASFGVTRSLLRKSGWNIPLLPTRGGSLPDVGPAKQKKGSPPAAKVGRPKKTTKKAASTKAAAKKTTKRKTKKTKKTTR